MSVYEVYKLFCRLRLRAVSVLFSAQKDFGWRTSNRFVFLQFFR